MTSDFERKHVSYSIQWTHISTIFTKGSHKHSDHSEVNSLGVDVTYRGNIAVILHNSMYVEYSEITCTFSSSIFCNLKIVEIWKSLNGFMATEYSKKIILGG